VAVVDTEKCKYLARCGLVTDSVCFRQLTVILWQLLVDKLFELLFLELEHRRVQIWCLKAIIRYGRGGQIVLARGPLCGSGGWRRAAPFKMIAFIS
jgi:hypothetical protein